METKHVDVNLQLEPVDHSLLTRDYILGELTRCRDEAVKMGYTLSDQALSDMVNIIVANPTAPDIGRTIEQMIRERAKPIAREAGRMLVSAQPGQNRKQRRAAQAAQRRK